jgi:hypothetical protein
MRSLVLLVLSFVTIASPLSAAEAPKPLRALLVIGGCCHDYAAQKDILKEGLEKRANLIIDLAYSADKTGRPALPILGNPDYAKGYDLVIHDECAADFGDIELIKNVLAPHRAGLPGVNLHCAMHSYRFGPINEPAPAGSDRGMWFEYLGVHSSRHGPQLPIAVAFTNGSHPITRGLANWSTGREELYNNVHIYPGAQALAHGKQVVNGNEVETVVAWTNEYRGARVFSTTLGHNNDTVKDERYLDLVARGVLWACKKLDDSGKPLPGYGPIAR